MAAAKKKTKPEIYTKKFVLGELEGMVREIKTDESIVFLGELFFERDYSRQRFSDWEKKFEDDDQILDTIKRIKDLLETRAVKGGMSGKLNPTMTIFHLKNNYKWSDKQELEHSGKDGGPIKLEIEFVDP